MEMYFKFMEVEEHLCNLHTLYLLFCCVQADAFDHMSNQDAALACLDIFEYLKVPLGESITICQTAFQALWQQFILKKNTSKEAM